MSFSAWHSLTSVLEDLHKYIQKINTYVTGVPHRSADDVLRYYPALETRSPRGHMNNESAKVRWLWECGRSFGDNAAGEDRSWAKIAILLGVVDEKEHFQDNWHKRLIVTTTIERVIRNNSNRVIGLNRVISDQKVMTSLWPASTSGQLSQSAAHRRSPLRDAPHAHNTTCKHSIQSLYGNTWVLCR